MVVIYLKYGKGGEASQAHRIICRRAWEGWCWEQRAVRKPMWLWLRKRLVTTGYKGWNIGEGSDHTELDRWLCLYSGSKKSPCMVFSGQEISGLCCSGGSLETEARVHVDKPIKWLVQHCRWGNDARFQVWHWSYKEGDKCTFSTNILGPYNSLMHLCIHYFVQQTALVIKNMETGGVECI